MSLLQIGGTKKDLLSCSHLGTLTGFLIGLSIVEGKRQEKHLKQSSTSLVANFQNNIWQIGECQEDTEADAVKEDTQITEMENRNWQKASKY